MQRVKEYSEKDTRIHNRSLTGTNNWNALQKSSLMKRYDMYGSVTDVKRKVFGMQNDGIIEELHSSADLYIEYTDSLISDSYVDTDSRNHLLSGVTEDEKCMSGSESAYVLEKLYRRYNVDDHDTVSTFIQENDFLLDLLSDAIHIVDRCFGEGTRMSLRIVEVPETSCPNKLNVLIQSQHCDVTDAMGHLDELDDVWWLDARSRAKDMMNIDLEF